MAEEQPVKQDGSPTLFEQSLVEPRLSDKVADVMLEDRPGEGSGPETACSSGGSSADQFGVPARVIREAVRALLQRD